MPVTSNNYTPTTWVTGDTITATKLNNLEQGIQNASNSNKLYLCTNTAGILDRNYNDIKSALLANKNIFLYVSNETGTYYSMLTDLEEDSNGYYVTFFDGQTYNSGSASSNLNSGR